MTMSTHGVDELRASLTAHADAAIQAAPDAHAARGAELRTRIRRARNRRRGGIAGGIAAALVIAGGVVAATALPDRHAAGPEIAGHVVEQAVTVSDFRYRLVRTGESTPGEQRFTLHLPRTGPDRVVELVGTGLGGGTATLRDRDTDLARVDGGTDLAAPVPVGSDEHDVTVLLRGTGQDAQVGLAVYERDHSLPTGVSDGTAVFRSQVGAASLLGGAWGRPGQTTLRFTVEGPVKTWSMAGACAVSTSKPWRAMADYTVDGKSFAAVGCDGLEDRIDDPGPGFSQPERWALGAGPHTVTVRLQDRAENPLSDPAVVLGGAVYARGGQTVIEGMQVDHVIEADGRDWALDQIIEANHARIAGPAYVKVIVPAGSWRPTARHLTAGDRDRELSWYDSSAGVGMPSLGEVLAGSEYDFRIAGHPQAPNPSIRILVYRPAS